MTDKFPVRASADCDKVALLAVVLDTQCAGLSPFHSSKLLFCNSSVWAIAVPVRHSTAMNNQFLKEVKLAIRILFL